MQTSEPGVGFAQRAHVTRHRSRTKRMHRAWRYVGGHRDDAMAAEHQEGGGRHVVAAVEPELRRRALDEVAGAVEVAGGVLEADDVGTAARRRTVSLARSATVRPGTL